MAPSLPKASFLRALTDRLMTFLFPSWYGPGRKYQPEDHYMRGPGPKSRAKHDVGCAQGLRRSIESE
jgi:hypothetical protein